MAQEFQWTEARIEEMLKMWRTGFTTYQMAAHFHVTRNTICGKLHREKIRRGILEPKPRIRKPSEADAPRKDAKPSLPRRAGMMLPSAPVAWTPDEGQLASIIDVTGCRWPVLDDPAYVGGIACCNQPTDGGSYCAHHAEMSVAQYSQKLIRKTVRDAIFAYERKVAA